MQTAISAKPFLGEINNGEETKSTSPHLSHHSKENYNSQRICACRYYFNISILYASSI